MGGAGQLRIGGNVAGPARRLRRRATVVQSAIGVRIRSVRCCVEIDDAVVQDAVVGPAAALVSLAVLAAVSRRVASERAVVQRAAIRAAPISGQVGRQCAVVEGRIGRTAARATPIILLITITTKSNAHTRTTS